MIRNPRVSIRALALGMSLSIAAGIFGCATARPPVASEAERRAYAAAEAKRVDDPAAARAAYEQLIQTWPGGALSDDAEFQLGEMARADGDQDAAMIHYRRVVELYTHGDQVDPSWVRIAQHERFVGNPDAARSILGRVRIGDLPMATQQDAYRELAILAPNPVDRLRWLASLREVTESGSDLDAIDAQIDAILTGFDEGDLKRAARQLGERIPAARVEITRAERALDAGQLEMAREALVRAESLTLSPRYAQRLAAATERLRLREAGVPTDTQLPTFAEMARRRPPDTAATAGSVGAVLPLSGPLARFGQESLEGVLLAAGVFDVPDGERANVRVVVRDSAGNPVRAAAAVRELALDEEVSAIIGPLLSAECEAAAQVAEEEGVPLMALTAREAIAEDRPYVFRLRTRPVEDARLLAERASELGAERFAILYRNDAYGLGLRALFWDAVEERGGRVVAVASYDPQATDFAEPIRRLVGYSLLTDEEKKLIAKRKDMLQRARRASAEEAFELRQYALELTTKAGEPLPPIVDFDALFIPESHENVVLIAPQLAFHEVDRVRLLGPDGWYDEDLLRLGKEHVNGALFTSHFYPDSEVPYVRDFTSRYEAAFQKRPGVFAAQAYDATNLVLMQMVQGRKKRESVRRGVLAVEAYPGVSGVIGMRADGNAQKRPFLLGIERGRIVHYDD